MPAPWNAQDIGAPATAGSASFDQSTGTFGITAAGAGVGARSDQFTFIYQQVTGDVDVIARVDSLSAVNAWSKTGVMIRSSLAANAAHGYTLVSAGHGVAFQRRLNNGGSSSLTYGPTVTAPYWVRLVRKGTTVTSYSSVDGKTWATLTSRTVTLGATAYVGIATTSNDGTAATNAAVSHVSIVPLSLPAPQKAVDIGAPSIAGSTAYDQGVYRVHAGGTDIWGTSDQFHFVYQPMNGDGEVVAHVQSLSNSNAWAKTGVMIRETLAANSRHAFALVSAASGYGFQRRIDTGGSSQHTAGTTAGAPGWVRLVRTGSHIDAYQSTDGTTWRLIGSDTVPMADAVFVGLATTSHNTSTATDAVLDSFKVTQGGSTTNQPPTVALTAPADGSTFTMGNRVTLNAAANDTDGTVTRVDFRAGTTLIGSSSASPYTVTWSPAAAGTYSLTAVATDSDGATTTSAAVSVRVDPAANQPPSVSLTAPANGASYAAPASISLAATASDPENALARVDFYNGTTLLNSDTAAPYAFTWSSVPAGTYSVKAVAYDNSGASASSATVTVTVSAVANKPPTVTLTSPTSGATFTAPATVTLSANATDSDGTIARVEFYNGTTLLNSDTAAPYTFTWSSVPAGTYTVKAVAYDGAGASASSANASITVQNGSPDVVRAYGLDEGTGSTVTDNSGVGPAGTVSGATWTSGKYGQALSFSGAGQVNFGDLDLNGPMTVMGWMQTRTLYSGTCGSFIMKALDYGFEVCGGRLYAGVGANGVWNGRPSVALTAADLNIWKHAAFTYDGTTVTLFINGSVIGTAAAPHITTNNALLLGRWSSGEYWDGLIDEVRLYSRALSQSEIQSAMNTPIGTGTTNQLPTVTLTSPTNGATFTAPANVTLSANATDSDGTIARVEFYNGTTLLNSDTTAPYSFAWSSVPAGTYAVKAVAYDNSGASASSAAVTVTVSAAANTPPTVSLTSPTSGATFTAPANVTLSANATDSDGTIARVEFYNGATLLNSDTTAPYSFAWSSVPAGTYTVKAIAYDNSGASASSAAVTVTVSAAANKSPTVSLTSPTSGATFTAPANVTLSANATDSDGTIARVEFYNGTTLLNSDTTAPYSFTWSSVPAGTYTVKAIAYDNGGASTTSALSTITVNTSTTTPPTGVVFTASPDHATLVTSYELRIYASGADPNTATPIATSNLGKPTPAANNDITVSQPSFFSALAPGNYVAAVAAIGSGGSSLSTAVTFIR